MKKKNKFDFEKKYSRLQEIVEILDNPSHPIDDLISLFEEGMNISKELHNYLENAELKVIDIKNKLTKDEENKNFEE